MFASCAMGWPGRACQATTVAVATDSGNAGTTIGISVAMWRASFAKQQESVGMLARQSENG